jgi:predicted ATPase
VRKPVAELQSSLDRLVTAGLLFRQGVAPHATYLFKHALVQHAAYGTLLREPRRALRARIVETLENQFAEIAESRPELLARHATEAGQIEKAAYLWGRAGQRSLDRSALVEAASPLHRQMIPRPVQHGVGSGRRVNPKAFPISIPGRPGLTGGE